MKWLYVFSRFELSIPDRNRHAPDRLILFPISRNTDFVFPSDFFVPVSVFDKKKYSCGNGEEVFRPFPTFIPMRTITGGRRGLPLPKSHAPAGTIGYRLSARQPQPAAHSPPAPLPTSADLTLTAPRVPIRPPQIHVPRVMIKILL